MIRSAVTINLVPQARDGPFVFHGDLEASCRAAAELGFDGVELYLPDGAALEGSRVRQVLVATGLSLAAVGTGAGWVVHRLHLGDDDQQRRRQARDFVRTIVEFGAQFGAPAVIGSMQGPATLGARSATARGRLRDALDELGAHAAKSGVTLLLEPLNRYETKLINTLGAGAELIRSLATDNVRLLADFFHMNIEERDMAAALRAAAPHLGHVHFVDSNREAAGRGHIALEPLRDVLREIGYDGSLSAEARSIPDALTAAKATMETFTRLFR